MSAQGPGPRPPGAGRGVASGFVLSLPLGAAFLYLAVVSSILPWVLVAATVVVAFVLIRGTGYRRDLGSGLLIGGATLAIIFAFCSALISGL